MIQLNIYMHLFFSHLGYCRVLSRIHVLQNRSLLVIMQQYMHVSPKLAICPDPQHLKGIFKSKIAQHNF